MNSPAKNLKTDHAAQMLVKADPSSPALFVTGPNTISIKAGTRFAGYTFTEDAPVVMPAGGLMPGCDYAVTVADGVGAAIKLDASPAASTSPGALLGGFHFAPGGKALARAGGDTTPAINPFSIWDINFRPSCADPRGMARVETAAIKPFWCDIYLLGVDHLVDGTSKCDVTIADGDDPPIRPNGKYFAGLDYKTAVDVMKHHGKTLLSHDEFRDAAFGVTEKTSAPKDPKITKLDAARTSRFGLMQATGNMWVWGHDGDPDAPRASLFGGSWFDDGNAGSRCAYVGRWPDNSCVGIGARGRSDHLQLV
jgi:hypothetical protein